MLFDAQLDFVRQLVAVRAEELDAVVVVRIVRRADNDAGRQAQRAGEISDARRRHRARQHDVDARGGKARFEGRFEHVAGHARVFADQHRGPRAGLGPSIGFREHFAGRITEPQYEIGRDRRFAYFAPNAIRAEITTCHAPIPCFERIE